MSKIASIVENRGHLALRQAQEPLVEMTVITDVALCTYSISEKIKEFFPCAGWERVLTRGHQSALLLLIKQSEC